MTRYSWRRLTSIMAFVLVAAVPALGQSYENVDAGVAHTMWRSGVFVLDVRTAGEYGQGHIPCSYNSDFWQWGDGIAGLDALLDLDQEILVHCQSGGRSAQASQRLADQGFTNVHNLVGGMPPWISAGYPVVTDPMGDGTKPPADVNLDCAADAVDVQLVINGCLGLESDCYCDVNQDGLFNAIDVQLTINAALGLG